MWQECPICRGSGIDEHIHVSNHIPVCSVCKGKRIIDTLTGLPPVVSQQDERYI